jgi:ATP-dependent Lhr-like helicase
LRGIRHCIVDEIHALCTNKRGVFLALLLERLAALNPKSFVRIGLSATQRPLEEVARYLGGSAPDAEGTLRPRPVTIVDAGQRKDLDLQVVSPVEQFGPLPEKSVWPSIYRLLRREIDQHRSTIIFANNRRSVERITAQLNEESKIEERGSKIEEGESEIEEGDPRSSILDPLARAHHGSVSLEVRRATEEALKEGRLRAVVATASLELGIDMGAVDLVCQVESPGSVARGLQRVGRAGHLVGQRSKGRLIPKTCGDLLEQAVLAREMAAGRVEECRVPTNCLDVLAQQIVAITAQGPWPVADVLQLVRQAYPYRDLSPAALEAVLEMVSGRYRFQPLEADGQAEAVPLRPGQTLNALQPRISWDRVHNRLLALPGSQQLALVHGGAIPDTGQYAVYTTTGVRLGELDEEFIYERRVGEAFLLGTHTWRLEQIGTDRVTVSPAEGAYAVIPFWRGENHGRTYELGLAIGRFLRELNDRLGAADCTDWLQREFFLDRPAAQNLRWHVLRQRERTNCLPTDRTLYIEAFRDQLGDWQVLIQTPLGKKLHLALRLALENRLQQRLGYRPQCLHHDDGVLIRFTDTEEPVLDLLDGVTADNIQALVIEELGDSALFALRFRQNASRALLLPTGGAGKRAPLWLQRLRGRDLLQVARRHPDFPIVVETFRECLQDYLDVPRLRELLANIAAGEIEVVTRRLESPSPFASGLLFAFTMAYMYQYDDTESATRRDQVLDQQLLEQLLAPADRQHLLDPRAVEQVERRLRGVGLPPRTSTEMAEWLRRLGDVSTAELSEPLQVLLQELTSDGRAKAITLPGGQPPERWILAEEEALYQQAFGLVAAEPEQQRAAAETILHRFLNTHALVSLSEILERYPFDRDWAQATLERWSGQGRLVSLPARSDAEPLQWSAPQNLEQVERSSLGLLRREVLTVPDHVFADFQLRWQQLHPDTRQGPAQGVAAALAVLEGVMLPAELWEQVILPGRVPDYQLRWLDDLLASGEWLWYCQGDGDTGPGSLAFVRRESLIEWAPPALGQVNLERATEEVLDCLRQRGALFVVDLCTQTRLPPAVVRHALWQLLRLGLATNDRWDVIRRGEDREARVEDRGARTALRSSIVRSRSPLLRAPEGRWSLLPWAQPDPETQAVAAAALLLHRHGVVARELAQLDARMPPWRVLYEVLSRMELAGDVRRGYFVEGLSGAQFSLPEAARQLQQLVLPARQAPAVLVHSLDPANLYGSGAPFDLPLEEGRSFLRRAGNWLVLSAGRPVLLIEQQGKRLTTLPSAAPEQLTAAVALLPELLRQDRTLAARHKLTVSEWNGQPITGSLGQALLEPVGFVRDYQELTLYAAWR